MVDADFVLFALGIAVVIGVDGTVPLDALLIFLACAAVDTRVFVSAGVIIDEIAFGLVTKKALAVFTNLALSADRVTRRLVVTGIDYILLAIFTTMLIQFARIAIRSLTQVSAILANAR